LGRYRLCLFAVVLGLHAGLRSVVGGVMDYIVSGIASIGIFIYLIYALLKPEKF
jgi:K+-transporting ATPase KdpF subunit